MIVASVVGYALVTDSRHEGPQVTRLAVHNALVSLAAGASAITLTVAIRVLDGVATRAGLSNPTQQLAFNAVFLSELVLVALTVWLLRTRRPVSATALHKAVFGAQIPVACAGWLVLAQVSISNSEVRDLSLWTTSSAAMLFSMIPLLAWTARQRKRYILMACGLFIFVFSISYFRLHWGETLVVDLSPD